MGKISENIIIMVAAESMPKQWARRVTHIDVGTPQNMASDNLWRNLIKAMVANTLIYGIENPHRNAFLSDCPPNIYPIVPNTACPTKIVITRIRIGMA